LAAICRYFGFEETPVTINDKLKDLGTSKGYLPGTGNYVYGGITNIHKQIKERVTKTPMPLTDTQLSEIRATLDDEKPVMVQLDYNPRTAGLDSHFVTLVDYNPGDENDFTIFDPNDGRLKSLKAYLGWFRPSARKTIEKYIIYDGPRSQVVGNTVAVPVDTFPILVHGATEWGKVVAEYLPIKEAEHTFFDEIQKVVNGYKSGATSARNRVVEVEADYKMSETQVANLLKELAETRAECQRSVKLKEAEIIALKQAAPNIEKLKSEYLGTIAALEDKLKTAQEDNGIKNVEISRLEVVLKHAEGDQETVSAFRKMINFIKDIWQD